MYCENKNITSTVLFYNAFKSSFIQIAIKANYLLLMKMLQVMAVSYLSARKRPSVIVYLGME